MTITEKVAHLKGLVEGMDFNGDNKETKVLNEILDVLEDIALTVSDLDDEMGLVTEQLDAVDEDLAELEEVFYDECEDCCDCEDDMYEVECPNCGETVYFDEDIIMEGAAECPNCGTELEFDVDCDCDCEDCE
ncbi:MAG: hypothetical protein J1F37_06385 [Oscillospiraceae bacterium]|nr:hypothetical protein [Oscillospiraceae bacterium]MCH5190171.1 hypothetical protein [Oscillospiraceae bacterium]